MSLVPLWITIGIVCVAVVLAVAIPIAIKGDPYVADPIVLPPDPSPLPDIGVAGPSSGVPLPVSSVRLPSTPSGQVVALTTTLTEAYAIVTTAASLKVVYWQGSTKGTWVMINQLIMDYKPGPYAMSCNSRGVMWCAGGSVWVAFLSAGALGSAVLIPSSGSVTNVISNSFLDNSVIRILGGSSGAIAQVWNPTATFAKGPGWTVSSAVDSTESDGSVGTGAVVVVADGVDFRAYVRSNIAWVPAGGADGPGGTIVSLDLGMDGRVLVVNTNAASCMYKWNGSRFTGGSALSTTGVVTAASDENCQATAMRLDTGNLQVRYNDLSKQTIGTTVYQVTNVGSSGPLKFFGRTLRAFIPGKAEWIEIMT